MTANELEPPKCRFRITHCAHLFHSSTCHQPIRRIDIFCIDSDKFIVCVSVFIWWNVNLYWTDDDYDGDDVDDDYGDGIKSDKNDSNDDNNNDAVVEIDRL